MIKDKFMDVDTSSNVDFESFKISAELGKNFFEKIKEKNLDEIKTFYTQNLTFTSPFYDNLNLDQTLYMWNYLFSPNNKFKIKYEFISSDGDKVKIHWFASYISPVTQEIIHNDIYSTLFIKDGKIYSQEDDFDLKDWYKQAYPKISKFIPITFSKNIILKKLKKELLNNSNI